MNGKRILSGMLAAATLAAVFSGCTGSAPAASSSSAASSAASSAPASSAASSAPASSAASSAASSGSASVTSNASTTTGEGIVKYPVEGSPKIKYWVDLNSNVSATYKSMNDTPLTKQLIADTGIQVEYLHPAQGQQKEAFNLLLASGDLPDVIEYSWLQSYPGGPELAFKNKVLTPLNDKMGDWAADYKAFLDSNPDAAKLVRTDDGNYFGFPFMRGHEDLMVFYGPMVRADWLKELGLSAPETIEDWYNMLKAFKEKKGAASPLTSMDKDMTMFDFGFLSGAWGVRSDYSLDDSGKVVYGPAQPEYKEFLKEMNKWYKEGLIDQNFYTNDRKACDANLLNGSTGAIYGYAGSGMGKWLIALQEGDKNAQLEGVKYPTLNKGETPKLGQKDAAFMNNYQVAGVSANSKNQEAAFKFLNYGYSHKGEMLYNFGIEGESYTMVNDYPTFADSIIKPEAGKSMAQRLGEYTRSVYNGPFVQRLEYYEQYMQIQQQKDAVTLWKQTDADKYQLPPVTPTQEESKEYNAIQTEMTNWRNEWCIGAITGAKDVEKFETEFIAELQKIGLDRALEIQQGALDRFAKR